MKKQGVGQGSASACSSNTWPSKLILVPGFSMDIFWEPIGGTKSSSFIRYYEPLGVDQLILSKSHIKKRQSDVYQEKTFTNGSSLHMSFTAFGRFFKIHMYQYQRPFTSDATLQIVSSEGTIRDQSLQVVHLYQGYIQGDAHSHVHGCIINGTFDGVIKTSDENFFLEPAWYYTNISSSYHSVIYKESDVIFQFHQHHQGNEPFGRPSRDFDHFEKIHHIQHLDHRPFNTPIKDTNIFASPIFNNSKEFFNDTLDTDTTTEHVSNANDTRWKRSVDSGDETVRTCNLYVVIDHTFFEMVGRDLMRALAEVAYHVEESDTVYRGTDFNGDGVGDNVGLSIDGVTIFESVTAENYILHSTFHEADDYLSTFALYNFDAYCLGIVFTSVDFNDGVLGLAWVGYADPYGPPGGVCQQRVIYRDDDLPSSLNTALVTTINYGNRVPKQVTSVTVMHEIGHSFGSLHDPSTSECAPDGSYGNYIMFPKATDGDKPFNTQFSPCSTSYMAPVIAAKGPMCFQFYTGPYCGNQLVEDGEECDCGTAAQCILSDRCCTPQGGEASDMECTFAREIGSVCSPFSSSCCSEDCQVREASEGFVCLEETQCAEPSICKYPLHFEKCNTTCPVAESKANGTHCGSAKTCLNGVCQRGICATIGLLACQCVEDNMCEVCCQVDDTCIPISTIAPDILHVHDIIQPTGSACNNYTGYCDVDGNCIIVDSDSALHRLRQLFTKKGVDDVREWMQINWYYILAVSLGLVLVSTVGKIVQNQVSSESKHMTQRATRLAAVWKEARRQKAKVAEQRQQVLNMHSHISLQADSEMSWLGQLFPSAGGSVIREAIDATSNEKEAVLRLLSEGFHIKKLMLPSLKKT
ncbi:LOW QUALITY PROTEIN: disintegrin and metalloproteinase domain-containing protein 10-like [Amphiura filiformis]|uniref:LOW QUALITY PROTEIN: disintegrin and metalloproteinase domain-containing protein 10-like n=1 Tax=Amphiura filiformis TaxID=82378 RepID=UPI003B211F94